MRTGMLAALATLVAAGCADQPPEAKPPVSEVRFSRRDGTPIAVEFIVETPPFEVDLSFKPGQPEPADYEGRPIARPEDWVVRAFYLEPGTLEIPEGTLLSGGFNLHKPHKGPRISLGRRPLAPEVMEPGRHYYWGNIGVPKEPGTYDFVIMVYPTAEPFSPQTMRETLGRGTRIFKATAHMPSKTSSAKES